VCWCWRVEGGGGGVGVVFWWDGKLWGSSAGGGKDVDLVFC